MATSPDASRLVAYHPLVKAALDGARPSPQGPRLADDDVLRLGNELAALSPRRERDLAAAQLIVLVRELCARGPTLFAGQLVMLLVAVVGPRAGELMVSAGVAPAEAKRLVSGSTGKGSRLAAGLDAPKGRGVGPRKGGR